MEQKTSKKFERFRRKEQKNKIIQKIRQVKIQNQVKKKPIKVKRGKKGKK